MDLEQVLRRGLLLAEMEKDEQGQKERKSAVVSEAGSEHCFLFHFRYKLAAYRAAAILEAEVEEVGADSGGLHLAVEKVVHSKKDMLAEMAHREEMPVHDVAEGRARLLEQADSCMAAGKVDDIVVVVLGFGDLTHPERQ